LYFALAKNKTAHKKIGKSKFPFIKVYSSTIEEMLAIHMLLSKKNINEKGKLLIEIVWGVNRYAFSIAKKSAHDSKENRFSMHQVTEN